MLERGKGLRMGSFFVNTRFPREFTQFLHECSWARAREGKTTESSHDENSISDILNDARRV